MTTMALAEFQNAPRKRGCSNTTVVWPCGGREYRWRRRRDGRTLQVVFFMQSGLYANRVAAALYLLHMRAQMHAALREGPPL